MQPGNYSITGLSACGVEGNLTPLQAAEVDKNLDDPAHINNGGTTEGNYPDSQAFSFQLAAGTYLTGNNTITVSIPHPAEPYANSGSVLPGAQAPTGASFEQTESGVTLGQGNAQGTGFFVNVHLANGFFTLSNRTVRLDAFDPYNPVPIPAPGKTMTGSGTNANIHGLKNDATNDNSSGNWTSDGTATTDNNGDAQFWVTNDANGTAQQGAIVVAATDTTFSPSDLQVQQTATLFFSGGSSPPETSGKCPTNEQQVPALPATAACTVGSATCGPTWLLIENGVAYFVPVVTVGSASGMETATLKVPSDLPSTTDSSNSVTVVALDAISPQGEGVQASGRSLSAPNTPYAPDAFSITTTEDPVPGYPQTAPVFSADAYNNTTLNPAPPYPVDGDNSALTSSGSSTQVGATSSLTATATLRDAYDNPVNDTQVSVFQTGAGHANVAPQNPPTSTPYPTTANDGTVAYSVSDSCAETVNLEAYDYTDQTMVTSSGQPAQVPLTFTAGPPVAPDAGLPPATCSVPAVTSGVTVSVDGSAPVSGTQVPAPADGKTQATVQVTLGDQFGNADVCQQVILAATTNTSNATITPQTPTNPAAASTACPNPSAPGYTGTDGIATFTVSDSTAEQLVFGVTDVTNYATWPLDPTAHAKDVAQINFEGADAGASTVTANPTSAPADGQPLVAVTVTVNDKAGQPMQNKSVTLAGCTNDPDATSPPSSCTGDSSTTITPASTQTGSTGQETFNVADTGTPHTVYYQATDVSDGKTITQDAPVVFTPGGVGLTASPASVITDGSTSTVTFTLQDSNGNGVPGVQVSLTTPSQTAVISNAGTAQTDTNGKATFTVSDPNAEQMTFNATASYTPPSGTVCVGTVSGGTCNVAGSVSVNFISVPNKFAITPTPATGVLADGVTSSQVTVKATDANGHVIAGLPVALAATGSAQVTPVSPVTDGSGLATFTVTDVVAETVTLSAGYEEIPASGQPSLPSIAAKGCTGTTCTNTITFIGTEAQASTITALPSSAPADGSTPVTVTVTLQSGSPFSRHSVVLITGSSTATVTPSNVGGLTGANGVVTFTITDTRPESLTIYARDGNTGVILDNTASVTFVQTEVQLSTVTANPATQSAGGPPGNPATSTVTVTLETPSCTPSVSGHTVKLTSNSTTAVISGPAQTNSSGVATFTVSDPAAETVTLTAVDTTCGLTLAQTATVQFVTSEMNQSMVMISPVSTPAEGPAAMLTVTLLNASGAPISGHTVTVPTVAHATVIPQAYPGLAPGVTNAYGQAQFAVADNTVETVTLFAYDGTTELNEPAVVAFTADEANQSTLSPIGDSLPALGAVTTITVTLTSGGGAPIVGHSVLLTASSPTVSIMPSTVTTNASGKAQFTVSDSHAESVALTALDQATGVVVDQTLQVTFTANEQNQSTATATATVVQQKKTTTITVTLLNANGQPLTGHTVTLTTGSTTTKVTALTKGGVTTATGQIQFSVTDTAAETLSIMITDTTTGVSLYLPVTVSFVKP